MPQNPRPMLRPKTIWALAGLLVIGAGAITLPGARQESRRREAYLPQLQAQVRRDPYDGRLQALLGGRLMEAGDFGAAADALEHAVAVGEKNESVWLALAASKAAAGDPKAIGYLRLGAKEENTPGLAAALENSRGLGSHPAPDALARTICPQGPKPLIEDYTHGSFLNGLTEWWGRHHPEQSGFATRQRWVLQQPDNAQSQRLWGLALLRNRRPAEAAVALQRAATLAPNSPAAHLALAGLLEAQGGLAQASLEYIASLRLRRDWLPALMGLGRTALAGGMPAAASDVYAEAVRVTPNSADAWVGLGRANVAADQNYDTALRAFETASHLGADQMGFTNDYAIALRHNNRWEDAEALLRQHVTAVPADAFSHYLLAALLLDNRPTPERLTEAQVQSAEALRIAPHFDVVQLQMAVLLLRQGKPQKAIKFLRQLIAQDPANAKALLTLAGAYQKAGMTIQAERTSQQAASLSRTLDQISVLKTRSIKSPSDAETHRELAALYSATGQTEAARQEKQVADLLRTDIGLQGKGTETLASLIRDVLSRP